MNPKLFSTTTAVAALIFLGGCAAEVDAVDSPPEAVSRTRHRVVVEPGAKSFVDTKGREWTLLRTIEKSSSAVNPPTKASVVDEVRMSDLTDEELAESLRLVTVVGDDMYIEAFADLGRAEHARARARNAPAEKVTDSFVGAAHDGRAVIDAALAAGPPVRPLDPFIAPERRYPERRLYLMVRVASVER